MPSVSREVVVAIVAAVLSITAVVVAVSRSDAPAIPSPSPTPAPSATPPPTPALARALIDPGTIGAAETIGPTTVRSQPDLGGPALTQLRAGILLPVLDRRGAFLSVLTPCQTGGWVAAADVKTHPRATGTPRTLAEATIVIDPGHGGQLPGAVGPGGTPEKLPNAEIARRLADRLAPARVFLTLSSDFTAGLDYRAAIVNALGAHVFVSVHNNAEPDGPSTRPGSETYYQYRSPPSKRLAGLLYEEIVGVLQGYDAAWVADRDAGAKYRLSAAGTDYYALLRAARVPTVIAENLYLSNAPEEALLGRSDVLDALAGALAAGVRRFVETSDPGSGFVTPLPREPGPSGRLPVACAEPTPP